MRKLKYFVFAVLLSSCGSPDYVPKPKGYFRIDLPEKKYVNYNPESCPFSFDIPTYANGLRDSSRIAEPCWLTIEFPHFRAQLFITYKQVNNNLASYTEDSHALAYKHTIKADAIDETPVHTAHNVHGLIYDISGNAASPYQFYVTDSMHHFLRGSLYFNCPPQMDSLAPVTNFIKQDVIRLVTSLQWKQ